MKQTLVKVSVPFLIEFIRRKCRKLESGIFWEDGTVAIQTVTAEQAPVVCRVRAGDSASTLEYSVRSFDGRFWWPLFERHRALPASDYLASATKSNGLFLSMMNLSPATIGSSPRRDARQFVAQHVEAPQRKERWHSAERIAHRTLFCDDLVYLEGGCPVYFGILRGTHDRTLSLVVGSAEPERIDPVSRYLPGPRPKERRDAACRSLVYRTEKIGGEVDALRRRGFEIAFASKAEVHAELRSDRDVPEICADALVRRAVAFMDPKSFDELKRLLEGRLQPAGLLPPKIPPALSRDTLGAMVVICPVDDFLKRYGLEFEWATEALSRLDSMLISTLISELDDQTLSALLDSALPAQATF
jgi:hypothetical protein